MTPRRIVIGLLALAAVVAAAGCGSKSTPTSTAAAPADQWAQGACVAFVTWRDDVQTAASDLKATPTADVARESLGEMRAATYDLQRALVALEAPGTVAGTDAKAALDKLKTQLHEDVTTIKDAVHNIDGASGSVAAISTISTTLVSMKTEMQATATTLRGLPKGELGKAIDTAPACVKLREGT